jgi:hypothetical protein
MLAWIGILSRVKEGKHVWIAIVPFVAIAYALLGLMWLLRCPLETGKYLYQFSQRRRWRTPEDVTELTLREKARDAPMTFKEQPAQSQLLRILSIEHILLPIARELHYTDVVNLSLTSKSVREVVFPTYDKKIRTEKLKQAACNGMFKQRCFCCNIMTCMVCEAFLFGSQKSQPNYKRSRSQIIAGSLRRQGPVFQVAYVPLPPFSITMLLITSS